MQSLAACAICNLILFNYTHVHVRYLYCVDIQLLIFQKLLFLVNDEIDCSLLYCAHPLLISCSSFDVFP